MDTRTLTDALRALDTEAFSWRLALYASRRGRDGQELEWSLCHMRGIAAHVGRLREWLLKKPVADKPVAPYSPFLSDKENIAALDKEDEMIREQVIDILLNIQNGQAYAPEDYVSGVMPKPTGFAFYGERKDEEGQLVEQALLMRRGSPFLSGSAAKLCTTEGDEVIACDKPILKFPTAVDFLCLGGACYLFSSAIEKDFALENRHFAIAAKRMAAIADAAIISNYDKLEEAAMKSKNARKFLDFDANILEHIVRLDVVEREEFLSTYGITVDPSGHMDSVDAEQCELIIDLLCCKSCLDPLGRLSVGSNITPRE